MPAISVLILRVKKHYLPDADYTVTIALQYLVDGHNRM